MSDIKRMEVTIAIDPNSPEEMALLRTLKKIIKVVIVEGNHSDVERKELTVKQRRKELEQAEAAYEAALLEQLAGLKEDENGQG